MPAAVAAAAAGPSLSFAFAAAGPAAAASTTTRRRSQQPVKKMKPEGSGNGKEPPGGPLGNVLRVFRRDGEFLRTRLQEQQQRLLQRAKVPKGKGDDEEPQLQPETTGPLGDVLRVFRRDREILRTRVQEPLSKALGDLFWFRNLEDPKALDPPPLPTSWPKITKYPPGLSGFDIAMADLEALVVYANHLKHISKTLFMPLPDHYDPELVSLYFSWRPHVLGFRIIQIFLAFASAAIKVQTSKSFSLEKYNDMNESLDSSQYQMGKLVKETLLKLGPTFIKVGQSLSTRPDIIGSEFAKALSELHDKVPPFPRVVAMKTIEEELGSPERLFAYISEEPVAAASFGQVYYARTLDGNDVAVKVQRPNLLHTVVRDIYILRIGLGILRNVAKRKSDLRLYADELGKGFVGELDYTREAANASDFLDAHSHYSFIVVPKVYMKLTRKRVLTMQCIIGESPTDLLLLSKGSFNQEGAQSLETQKLEAKLRLLDLVNKGTEAAFIQLLETGLLHADPHSGNLRYTPEGRIGFLDFGLLCRMEKKHQLAMLAAIIHIVNGDWKALVYDLAEMDIVRSGTSLYRVTMELEGALGEVVFVNGIPDIKFSRVLGKIWSVALKYHFRMPPYFTLVLRSLASLEGLAVAGDQNFKTFQAAYPYVVRKLLNDNSAATRRILYSVVFNKRRELQWKKILLFIRLGSTSKKDAATLSKLVDGNSSNNGQNLQEEVFKVANAILKILTSKNGAVLRRLLMDANANSSARALISKDAKVIRHHMSTALSDIIYQWMLKGFMRNKGLNYYDQISNTSNGQEEKGLGRSFKAASQTALSDRRLKVIFYKASNDIRREPILMFKLCWSFFMVFTRAAAIALHRLLVHISKTDATPFLPMRTAVVAQ